MFIIRYAKLSDMGMILDIYNDAISNSFAVYKEDRTNLEERISWFQKQKNMNYPIIVAQLSDTKDIMGYASFSDFRNFPGFCYTIEHSVYIAPAYRSKGVARKLMERIFEEAIKSHKKNMVAAIDSENIASIMLHKKLGFKKKGCLEKIAYKFGTARNLIFMQKSL